MTPEEIGHVLGKADEHLEKSEHAQAEALAKKVLASGSLLKENEARALCILGKCYELSGKYEEALIQFNNALRSAEAASNLSLQSRALNAIAWIRVLRSELE